jgi:hypothetical protein
MACRNRTDRQAAVHAGEQTLHGVPGIRELAQDRLRLGQQELAAGRQGHRPPKPLKQRRAHFRFELQNLLGERRLGDALLLRRPRKASHARHHAEEA